MRGSIAFPNDSRSYDATRVAVRFWGYDQSIEVPFFIGADVLGALQPAMAAARTAASRLSMPTGPASAPSLRRSTAAAAAAPTIFSPAISESMIRDVETGSRPTGFRSSRAAS